MADVYYTNCPSCKGKKKVIGLGLMKANCSYCKGIGFVEAMPSESVDQMAMQVAHDELKAKRGRPKKLLLQA